LLLGAGSPSLDQTDRERDGLLGPVRQVTTTSRTTSTTQTYDANGALLETIARADALDPAESGEVQKTVYLYDASGRRIREMIMGEDGQEYVARLYGYDAVGRRVAEAAHGMCASLARLRVFAYDEAGRLRDEYVYQFRVVLKLVYAYDGRGVLVSRAAYRKDRLEMITRYVHDANGRLIEESDIVDGRPAARRFYEYDERGNKTKQALANLANPSLNAKEAWSYEYDAQGNWITRTRQQIIAPADPTDDRPPVEITRRTIEYY
jgi:hypothetical protein